MKVLITGATGFVGRHLLDYLRDLNVETFACYRPRSQRSEHEVDWVEMDITDAYSVAACIKNLQPHVIFHLAAQSFVPTSWGAPTETFNVNALGTLHLLEAVRTHAPECVVQVAGSSEEYGFVHEHELPITESNPLRPLSPYAVSKVAADMFARQYHASYGVKAIVTRAFNHTGPGRPDVFVESNFARQIARIEAGLQKPVIKVGNLEARRDYSDVRDMVRAYWLATQKCEPGDVYNISSGRSVPIRFVLDTLCSLSDKQITSEVDSARLRPSDVPVLLGDCTKFREATAWEPTIPLEQTLGDILDYWRAHNRHPVPQQA